MTTERYKKKKMVNITIGFSDINTEEKNYAENKWNPSQSKSRIILRKVKVVQIFVEKRRDRVKIKMTPLPVRILRIFSNFFNRVRQSIWQPLTTDLIQFPISTVTDISGITISNSSRESIVKNMKGEGTMRSIFTSKISTMKSDDGMKDLKRISDFSTSYDYPTKFNLELELKM